MHKRAFQALKCMFLHVSGFPPLQFDKKKQFYRVIGFFKSKYGGGRLRHA